LQQATITCVSKCNCITAVANPEVAFVTDTSKLAELVIIILPPPAVRLAAEIVNGEALEGPEPAA
jgi:hypothetical protein